MKKKIICCLEAIRICEPQSLICSFMEMISFRDVIFGVSVRIMNTLYFILVLLLFEN